MPIGEIELRVSAFGYVERAVRLTLEEDLEITVELEVAPFILDSLVVAPGVVEIEGSVQEEVAGAPLYAADVLVNHQPIARTNPRGRFALGAWEGVPVLLSVRAFGYVAVDTVIIPSGSERYDFSLGRDTVVDRLIQAQIERLEARPSGTPAIGLRPLSRETLGTWSGVTLAEVLEGTYATRIGAIECVVIDEEPVPPSLRRDVLRSTLPGAIERIEFLFGGRMLRVYTREFMRALVAGISELTRPNFVDIVAPPLCT